VVSLAVEAAAEVAAAAMVAGVAMEVAVVAESSPALRALSPFASLG
jgi:hypothetical protein